MNTELTELQKLKLELLKMYDGDLVNAKLAFNFIAGLDFNLDKYRLNKQENVKRASVD